MQGEDCRLTDPFDRPENFARNDETNDRWFYAEPRMVAHLDALAREKVSRLIGGLVTESKPVILDLMASWDSHLPDGLDAERIVGLGLNEEELSRNEVLDEWVVHDLNRDPRLPFPDETFDAVLNVVSVDYMTRPFEVFREAARVLKPGGLFLVVYSDRMFPEKAVKVWREADSGGRRDLVSAYFTGAPFEDPRFCFSVGDPRPLDDKYAPLGIPSDPVFALFAERRGGVSGRPDRRIPEEMTPDIPSPEELERRKSRVKQTLRCPHCEEPMKKWAVPQTPFTEWDTDFMYICFNDRCPYLRRGWLAMERQGNPGVSYRQMYHPGRDAFYPVPVQSLRTLRDGIVEEEAV